MYGNWLSSSNNSTTIISGDRTKWLSINSLLFWKIGRVIVQRRGGGGEGVHLPIIKSPVHHSIHSPLFFRKIVGIEDSALITGGQLGWINPDARSLGFM